MVEIQEQRMFGNIPHVFDNAGLPTYLPTYLRSNNLILQDVSKWMCPREITF